MNPFEIDNIRDSLCSKDIMIFNSLIGMSVVFARGVNCTLLVMTEQTLLFLRADQIGFFKGFKERKLICFM